MYNLEDKSYQSRPKIMSEETRDMFFEKLMKHVQNYQLGDIVIYLHGGEPLLVTKPYFVNWVEKLLTTVGSLCNVILIAQTNGILLDNEWIEIFHRFNIRLGISLDGPKAFHDTFRVTKNGAGTYDKVMLALKTLRDHPLGAHVFGSILSVANPDIPPEQLWQTWLRTGFKRFDFNLPHCTHDNPPWFTTDQLSPWLIELFELWWTENDPEIDVRFFRNIVHLILGASSSTDYIGGKQVGIVVIETDGSIQGTDALRACKNGLTNVNMNVFTNNIQDAMNIPLVKLSNNGASRLCQKCLVCDVKDVCGGGYVPHRYRERNDFDNPSVYCESLYRITKHIRNKILFEARHIFDKGIGVETL